ncbi:cupin domain-containing protein [Hymenobacter jeollabukensis]|uniref:Cupin domain-containing protein n=1 Tax=Hymenobacter jeollabukensis TaxID=2025313 RepID=A0A5R8WQN8_9BACT|nr:cupin domain-containing protein [Hymenobacter jeollabukensis]TLM92281.1 cupin domain-containing protein [Hymenobacter jeollabukensis]
MNTLPADFPAQLRSVASAEHYHWVAQCDGWHLVDTLALSVIQERMPPGTAEQYHYHERAQQFFYVLRGEATFDVDGRRLNVVAGAGLHVPPGTPHRILNLTSDELHFTVTSQPKAHGDRVLVAANSALSNE